MAFSLSRIHRPVRFADVVGQEPIVLALTQQLRRNLVGQAYLFTGPRGVGKTTLARLLGRAVNCEAVGEASVEVTGEPCGECVACKEVLSGASIDLFEVDAASHTDVDHVREHIIKNSRFAPQRLRKKVFIIDEVHMLSLSAFNALLKTLEEPPEHVLFLLATTDSHKIPATVLSRCQRFDVRRIGGTILFDRLEQLCKKEHREVAPDVLWQITRLSDGCVRDAESLLAQVLSLSDEKITPEIAAGVLPSLSTTLCLELITAIFRGKVNEAITALHAILEDGSEVTRLLDEVIGLTRVLLLTSLQGTQASTYPPEVCEQMERLAHEIGPAWCARALEAWMHAKISLANDRIPELGMEVVLVELALGGVSDAHTPLVVASAPAAAVSVPKKEEAPLPSKTTPPKEILSFSVTHESVAPKPPAPAKVIADTPPPLPETPAVHTTPPNISQSEVEQRWAEVFQELKNTNVSLPLIFQNGRVIGVTGDEIQVGFEFSFHADTVNQERHRKAIHQVLVRVFQQPLFVKGVYVHASADETVSQLLETFGRP